VIAARCLVVIMIRAAAAAIKMILESVVVMGKDVRISGHLYGINHMVMMVQRVIYLGSIPLEDWCDLVQLTL